MIKNRILVLMYALLITFAFGKVEAQNAPSHPFVSAKEILETRGETPNASTIVSLEINYSEGNKIESQKVMLTLANDWGAVNIGQTIELYDFKLNRTFIINKDLGNFTSQNLVTDVLFRVLERQNRNFMNIALSEIAPSMKLPTSCDYDSELGIAIERYSKGNKIRIQSVVDRTSLSCDDVEVGSFEKGLRADIPATFWPILARRFSMHPQLLESIKNSNAVPKQITTSYFRNDKEKIGTSIKLVSIESTNSPYPITHQFNNVNGAWLNTFLKPGYDSIAINAIKDKTYDQSWEVVNSNLEKQVAQFGRAKAAISTFAILMTFPEQLNKCSQKSIFIACKLAAEIPILANEDKTLGAYWAIITAKTKQNKLRSVELVSEAAKESNTLHPVLGASFALLLLEGDKDITEKASQLGVALDPKDAQIVAIREYPNSPAYWTDLSDSFIKGYRIPEAIFLTEIAESLPSVLKSQNYYTPINSRRELIAKVTRDFPYFFLETKK